MKKEQLTQNYSLADTPCRFGILGAGVTGLSAALGLLDAGVPADQITIIEAQDRVGGRISGLALKDGTIIERGAAWFHLDDDGDNPFMRFVRERYGKDIAQIVPEGLTSHFALTKQKLKAIPLFDEEIDALLRREFQAFKLESPEADISLMALAERILDNKKGRAMIHVQRLAENYMGSAHANQSSASEVFTDPYSDGGPQVAEGLQRYTNAMEQELRAKGVTIHLGCPIIKLGETPPGAWVVDKKGQIYGFKTLICTLPVPVLKTMSSSNQLFTQELGDYVGGIQTSHFSKIIVPMDEAFLRAHFTQNASITNTARGPHPSGRQARCHSFRHRSGRDRLGNHGKGHAGANGLRSV